MKKFRVEAMNKKDYANYMCGGNAFAVKVVEIEANDKEEARAKAMEMLGDDYVVNDYVEAVEDYEARKAEEKARREAEELAREEAKAKAKARREANELAKAEAEGLDLEAYRNKVKKEAKIRKAERDLAEALALVEKARKYLEWVKNN